MIWDPVTQDFVAVTAGEAFPATGNLSMATHKLTNVGTATAGSDAVNKTQMDTADALKLPKTGALTLDFVEQATPAAPAATHCEIYAKDVAGKVGLYVRFPSGAEQQIKVEA